jgi:alkylation response protein AidB-like acyl-CoA dehydrogenase
VPTTQDRSAGLSFRFTDDQQLFRSSLHEFVERRLPKDYCREVEAREEFPRDLWERLTEPDLHGVGIPEEYGGQGGGIIEQMIVAEELSRTMAGLVWIWGVTAFAGAKAIAHFGTEEQKDRLLPDIAAGRTVFSISLTEPDGGTDVLGAMHTRARRVDGGWVVNGSKMWSTMAHVADMLLLVARTEPDADRPSRGITVFLCDARTPGITATPIPKLGMRSLGSCEVQLQDVFIPDENVLGEVNRGWSLLAETLNSERIMVAAQCCGVLQGVLEDMVAYASERTAFGKQLGAMQAVQHKIADTHMGLETARLHTYRAGWLQLLGEPCGVEATMAKVLASEAAVKAADDGIQILGGNGYALEYDMQRYWRDIRLYRIAPINNEMGRNFIGESLGLPRSF